MSLLGRSRSATGLGSWSTGFQSADRPRRSHRAQRPPCRNTAITTVARATSSTSSLTETMTVASPALGGRLTASDVYIERTALAKHTLPRAVSISPADAADGRWLIGGELVFHFCCVRLSRRSSRAVAPIVCALAGVVTLSSFTAETQSSADVFDIRFSVTPQPLRRASKTAKFRHAITPWRERRLCVAVLITWSAPASSAT